MKVVTFPSEPGETIAPSSHDKWKEKREVRVIKKIVISFDSNSDYKVDVQVWFGGRIILPDEENSWICKEKGIYEYDLDLEVFKTANFLVKWENKDSIAHNVTVDILYE